MAAYCDIRCFTGIGTGLTPEDVNLLFDEAEKEGFLRTVAFERVDVTREDFREFVANPDVFFAAGFDEGGRPLGWFHLTGFEGRTARIHFCFFEAGKKDRLELGAVALDYCFSLIGLGSLIGVVPVINPGAIEYVRRLGGREFGLVPEMCRIERLKRSVGGMVFVFEPEKH